VERAYGPEKREGGKVKRPAVFMDRDGTVNEQVGYVNHTSRFHLLPGVCEAIRLLNERDFLAIIVTNQSGVARGYFPISLVHKIHTLLDNTLKKKGASIDGIFFCPHYPGGSIPEFTRDCDCRKPGTGLIKKACDSFDIDMSRSCVVGDNYTDLEMASRCGLDGILVKTGYGLGDLTYVLPQTPIKPCYIADDLLDAVKWIIQRDEGKC
jgi:D-glycero-D-manno-heptose 1,7-bisphosphate phosphatase